MVERAAVAFTLAGPYEGEDYLAWVKRQIWGEFVNSDNRVGRLLECLYRAPSDELMWQAFNLGWDTCDAVAPPALTLLRHRLSRSALRGWQFLDGDSSDFFASLPDTVTVFRGASRQREHGVSWTTDLEVARGFARGHRGIAVPEPAIFSARVEKRLAWSAAMERGESELILDPAILTDISTHWTEVAP